MAPSANLTPCYSQRSFLDPHPVMSLPCLKMLAVAFHLQVPHPFFIICHLLSPLPGCLILFPLSGRHSPRFWALWIILGPHSWTRAGVGFPSPAPQPALSPAGEALLGHRHPVLCVPTALRTTPAPGWCSLGLLHVSLLLLTPLHTGEISFKAGAGAHCPPYSPHA